MQVRKTIDERLIDILENISLEIKKKKFVVL